jgi:hypothetical protein
MVHAKMVRAVTEIVPSRPKRPKAGGRQRGTPNRVTTDIRRALRDLAEGNANLVQGWLDRVAENDPAEALRLWLALLRFVTPTLQAAAIADVTPKSMSHRLAAMSDDELLLAIKHSAPIPLPGKSAPALPKPDPDDEELLR